MNRLNSRERFLICFLAGALFLVVNGALWSGVCARAARLRADLSAQRSQLGMLRAALAGEETWAARDAWISAAQPKLKDPEQAGVRLLEQIKETARASDALLESPELGGVEARPACQAVSVQVTVKSTWSGVVRFLHTLQPPGRFVVLESATFQADAADPARMTCQLKIAQWYAL